MSSEENHEQLAEQLDEETDKLSAQSDELAERIEDVRSDWEAKRRDASVPGAPPPSDDEESLDEPSGDG